MRTYYLICNYTGCFAEVPQDISGSGVPEGWEEWEHRDRTTGVITQVHFCPRHSMFERITHE